MKKFLALLLALVMVFALAACGEPATDPSDAPSGGDDTQTSDAPEGGDSTATGSVYYLNFKPEADAAWQELAALYTEQTGVTVKVVTAASGEYSSTLTAEMDKSDMPTLFQCGNQAGLDTWGDYCYEAFGIIVNTALLAEAGYELSDITNFESLKSIAEDITARHATGELAFAAFSSSGLDSSSSWRFSGHLANMPLFYEFRDDGVTSQPATITGAYLDNFKMIWDLYVANSDTAPAQLTTATSDQSKAEFGEGKAVFYQNGSWEYDSLVNDFGMDPANLAMIPIYCGVEGEEDAGLCCGTENCWAVNAKASEEDIQATLDFMYWVVTSEEGTTMMAEQFGPIPFKNAKESSNVFFNNANEYIADGKYTVTWAFNYTPNVDTWRAAVVAALTQYTVGGGSWDDVVTAFVQGWATQYANQ